MSASNARRKPHAQKKRKLVRRNFFSSEIHWFFLGVELRTIAETQPVTAGTEGVN